MKQRLLLLSLIAVFAMGCSFIATFFPSTPARIETVSSPISVTRTVNPEFTPPAEYVPHRIGIRVVDGVGEFYDQLTGEKFIPRGYNYVRLSPINGTSGQLWEETLAPGIYDPELAEDVLRDMHGDGYNVVRVYIDCCRPGKNIGSNSEGISSAYINNVIDFLTKAKANDIFVLLVLHLTPADGFGYYNAQWNPYTYLADGANLRYLTPGGFKAKNLYDQDLIRQLIKRKAPLDAVFAYDLTDGVSYDLGLPPLNKTSGTLRTPNGKVYDLGKPEDKRQMMAENLVYWIDTQRAAILDVDPTALVTASFNPYHANAGATFVKPVIWDSSADFVDLQIYLGTGSSLKDYANLFGFMGMTEKPIIMGQFAAYQDGFSSASDAALELEKWQAESCRDGIDGWILWLRGSEEHTVLWNGTDEGGVINDTLAPVNRPDPCQQGTRD